VRCGGGSDGGARASFRWRGSRPCTGQSRQPRKPLQTEQKQLKLTDARCCCYVAQHVAHNLHLADIELEDGMLEKAIEVCWEDKAKL
jgi:hypothetical protein